MARIRTIKPEFFTSEDICALSPLARLLYIGVWCEADREGRLEWKPKTLKTRYLPHDAADINTVCVELIASELVVLYGDGFAHIPTFLEHQIINPREPKSKLPVPPERVVARVTDASLRVSDAPSLPTHSIPFPSKGESRGGSLIMSPQEHARLLEFNAFVGSRLRVPKSLHQELVTLLGGPNPSADLLAWYADLNTEIEATQDEILDGVYKWLKARYAQWRKATQPPKKTAAEIALAAYARQTGRPAQ